MSYTLVINNKNVVGSGNNTYQYNFIQGNFTVPEGTEMMIANIQIPYSFYNITSAYGNNTLIFNWPTSSTSYISYNITIPDGFYTTTSLSNYLQQWMISNGFYLYNSTTAQNVYYLSLVYNTYQYGNQILLSPVPTTLPSGYALPSGYTSSTVFGGYGFPTISRTPFVVLPFLKTSSASSTIGDFLGYGSYTTPTFIPAITSQQITTSAGGASITANITGDAVSSLTIGSGGYNYVNPFISFSGGGGSGAVASLIVSNGVITGYNLSNGGTGYTSAPTCTVSPSPITATISAGGVSGLTIVNGGNYTTTPTIAFVGTTGSGATATVTLTAGVITSYSITSAGTGYTTTPTVVIIPNNGGSITANLTSTSVSSLTITGGSNYVNPSVSFSGGGGSGASATLIVTNGVITGYNLISGGTGYATAPTCTITNNGGNYSANSTITPVGSTVNSIIVRCSIVKNNVGFPNDVLDSFPISAGTAFGTNINYTPNIEKYVKVSSGSFSNFVITFTDQNLNLLASLDNNILITLLLKFPSK